MSSTQQQLDIKSPIDQLIDSLNRHMSQQGLSESELARQAHIPQPTLNKILSGKTTDPRISTLKSLANYFSITIDQLFTGFYAGEMHQTSMKVQSIPILSWNDCLKGKNFLTQLTPSTWQNWLHTEYFSTHVYGLISKPSMEPRFPRGAVLIISMDAPLVDGNLVVVHYPNTAEATLRELSIDGPNQLLLPINSNAQPDVLNTKINLLGTVAQSRFSYGK